jgi:hypothetical protein
VDQLARSGEESIVKPGTVKIEGDKVVFELHGADRILAIKRTMAVPLRHVKSVSTETVGWKVTRHLRVMGSFMPGLVKDGRFLTSDGLMFFEMRHRDKCITVTLDNELYKKVIFEVDDKEAAARTISDAIAKQGSRPA